MTLKRWLKGVKDAVRDVLDEIKRKLGAKSAVFVAILLTAGLALAQAVPSPTPQDQPPDWNGMADTVVVAILPALVYYIRKVLPKMPRVVVWAIPLLLGAITTTIGQQLDAGVSGWRGLMLGMLAISVRELASTFKQWGFSSGPPPTVPSDAVLRARYRDERDAK